MTTNESDIAFKLDVVVVVVEETLELLDDDDEIDEEAVLLGVSCQICGAGRCTT